MTSTTDVTTRTFIVDPRNNGGQMFRVRAENYGEAATRAARRILRTRSRRVVARRDSGDPGLSGLFQAYESDRLVGGLNSRGLLFHVMEA